jgi:hypothetical protein
VNVPTRLSEEDFPTNSSRSLQLTSSAQIMQFINTPYIDQIESLILRLFLTNQYVKKFN